MMTGYQINSQNINFEDLEEYLELIVEIVLKPSRFILKKLNSLKIRNNSEINKENCQTNQDVLIDRYNEFKDKFDNDKVNLYHALDSLANALKENELFYDEYFDFCEIQDIIKDIFNRDFSLIRNEDFEFILQLVVNFSKIVNYKSYLVQNNDFKEEIFESKYNEYLTDFNKSKKYYYENICDESLDEDLFVEYTNIIMG